MSFSELTDRFGVVTALPVALVVVVAGVVGIAALPTGGPAGRVPEAITAGGRAPARAPAPAPAPASGAQATAAPAPVPVTPGAVLPTVTQAGAGPAAPAAVPGEAAPLPVEPGGASAPESAEPLPAPAGAECREDGRQVGISVHMPPCVPRFSGDNGGVTARGVTTDKVIVARWIAQADPATTAALVATGVSDDREDTDRMTEVLFHYNNTHYETYGREIVWVDVEASGAEDNDASQRADAVRIADEIGAFAAYGAPSIAAEELAARDVICICAIEQGKTYYQKTRNRVFSTLAMLEEYYQHTAEFQGKRLAGKNAKWAGEAAMQAQPRKFGLIWPEGATLVSAHGSGTKEARDFYVSELARYGVTLTKDASYAFDLSRAQEQATNIIVQMKNAGVTTLAFVGDFLYPIFITKEATRQLYFPEWFIVGTLLTDTTFFGRTYDQAQWAHAYGISPLWVFWANLVSSRGYREYHHACLDVRPEEDCQPADRDEGVSINAFRENIFILFTGFHMAGPNLTPETYTQGMFSYPPSGGIATVPLYYWTPESPASIKDFTEIFWDSQGQGKDEVDKDGVGIMLKMNRGKRYQFGEWPSTEPAMFNRENTVFTSDDPPSGLPHEQDGHRHPEACRSCSGAA